MRKQDPNSPPIVVIS